MIKTKVFNKVLIMLVVVSMTIGFAKNMYSELNYGSMDTTYDVYVEALESGQVTEEGVLADIELGGFSQPVVAKFLDDGYLRQYEARLKAG